MRIPFNTAEGSGPGAPAGSPIKGVGPTGRPGGWLNGEILAVVAFNVERGVLEGLDPAAFGARPDGSIVSDTVDTSGLTLRVLYTR